MSFIDDIKNRAKKDIKTIVLPEAEDIRILQATDRELKKSVGKLTDLIRDKYSIEFKDKGENVEVVFLDNTSGEYIIDMEEPNLSSKLGDLDRDKLFEVYWDDCAYDNYFEQNEKFAESYSKQLKMIFG